MTLEQELLGNPYLQAWGQKLKSAEGQPMSPKVETPSDVLGEQAFLALAALVEASGLEGEQLPPEVRESMASDIYKAIPFYWANSVDHQIADLPLPRFVVGAGMLPAPTMWISLEGEHPTKIIGLGQPIDAPTQGVLIRETPKEYAVLVITAIEKHLRFNVELLKIGSRYPDDLHPSGLLEALLKFLAFVNSPYTEIQKQRPSRADRRRAAKLGWQHEPEIHVVKLRAKVQQAREMAENGEVGTRLWQHRWWVRGHFRAQWYASTQSHKVIWVAPYVKGPEDKPFRSAVYSVVR